MKLFTFQRLYVDMSENNELHTMRKPDRHRVPG